MSEAPKKEICSLCFELIEGDHREHEHQKAHEAQVQLDHHHPEFAVFRQQVVNLGEELMLAQKAVKSASFREQCNAEIEECTILRESMMEQLAVAEKMKEGPGEYLKTILTVRDAVQEKRLASEKRMAGREEGSQDEKEQVISPEKQKADDLLKKYGEALAELKNYAEKEKIQVPWRLAYFVETHMSAQGGVELEGGIITDANGNLLWNTVCRYCGVLIQRGGIGLGTTRVARLDSDQEETSCMVCWNRFSSYAAAIEEKEGRMETIREDQKEFIKFFRPPDQKLDIVEAQDQVSKRASVKGKNLHIARMLNNAFEAFADRPCLGGVKNGKYEWIKYKEMQHRVLQLANYFSSLDKEKKVKANDDGLLLVGISSQNRAEYLMADMAAAYTGMVSIGLHTTSTPAEQEEVVLNAGIAIVVCDAKELPKFIQIAITSTALQLIICMEDVIPSGLLGAKECPAPIVCYGDIFQGKHHSTDADPTQLPLLTSDSWEVVTKKNKNLDQQRYLNLFSIIYTSGTAGSPKGTLHDEVTFTRDVGFALNVYPLVTISYIPLSHSTDRMRVYENILNGGRCGFATYAHSNWNDHEMFVGSERFQRLREVCEAHGADNGVGEIIRDISLLKPTVFIAPPRIWKGMETILAVYANHSKSEAHAIQDVKAIFGPRVKAIATGGGPTDTSTFDFVKKIFDIPLLESFGCTEVGGIAAGIEGAGGWMSIAEGATVKTENNEIRGELFVHTDTMSEGYWKNEKTTNEVYTMINGLRYFKTGDICDVVYEDINGQKKITKCKVVDRKKHMMKIGKQIEVGFEEMEANFLQAMCGSPIEHCAVICHDVNEGDYSIIICEPSGQLQEAQATESIKKQCQQMHWPDPKVVVLDREHWAPSQSHRLRGELTVSLKVNRPALALKFAKKLPGNE